MSFVPYVVEQSSHGERSYDIFSRLLNDRIILLHDQVNSATTTLAVAELTVSFFCMIRSIRRQQAL